MWGLFNGDLRKLISRRSHVTASMQREGVIMRTFGRSIMICGAVKSAAPGDMRRNACVIDASRSHPGWRPIGFCREGIRYLPGRGWRTSGLRVIWRFAGTDNSDWSD